MGSQQQPVRQHRAAHCPLNMNILSLLLLTWLGMASSFSRVARVQMIQRQSCYFTPYDKQLTCQCTNHQTVTFLGLKLMFFIKEKGQEVRSVLISSCPDVMIGLDLTGVNPKSIPIKFKNCGKISFSYINFDRQFSGGQLLKFNMETVNSVKMEDLDVRDALQIKTNKVKEIVIKSSNFTHLPLPGLEIRNADKLSISDSYFHRISAGSVTVKSAKEVEVINNQFSINAIQVVKSNEGSRLYISCNRIIGESQSPECVTTSTAASISVSTVSTVRRTTTTISITTAAMTGPETSSQLTNDLKNEKEEFISMELLIGLVIGVALLVTVLLIVVIVLCCKKRGRRNKKSTEISPDQEEKLEILDEKNDNADSGNNSASSLESPRSPERQSLLEDEQNKENLNSLIEASKPKFSSPVWLDEIQRNKIFNKQRSINTEEDQTQRKSKKAFPVRSISEIIDSESDNEVEEESPSVSPASPPVIDVPPDDISQRDDNDVQAKETDL